MIRMTIVVFILTTMIIISLLISFKGASVGTTTFLLDFTDAGDLNFLIDFFAKGTSSLSSSSLSESLSLSSIRLPLPSF